MNRLETLVKKYDEYQNKADSVKQLINQRVKFKGFLEDDYEQPEIVECSDGLIAAYGDKEIPIDIVIELMNSKGYIEPDDFV